MAMGTDMVMVMEMRRKSNLFTHFLQKRPIRNFDLLEDMTDVHSHYLSGVDDGMNTFDETLDSLSKMLEHRVKNIYFTPHVMTDYSVNTPFFLKKKFEEFKEQMPLDVNIRLAAEYMFDASFSNHMDDELLTMTNGYVLVEMSYFSASPELNNFIYQLQLKNYKPILAHPERYMFMEKEDYKTLKARNVKFQMNLLSLSGVYGRRVYDVAWYLLQEKMYDFCGTDIHNYDFFSKKMMTFKLTNKEFSLVKTLIAKNEHLW